jgi:two-component sensor histidine kinase
LLHWAPLSRNFPVEGRSAQLNGPGVNTRDACQQADRSAAGETDGVCHFELKPEEFCLLNAPRGKWGGYSLDIRSLILVDRGGRRGWVAAVGWALFCVGAATLARIACGILFGPTLPFATYFPAILVAALFAGSFAGLLALALSIFVVWWAFTPPYYEFAALTLPQVANVVLFSFSAGLVVWLAAVYRSLLNDMRQHEKQRDLLVGEIQHRSRNILTVVESLIHQTIPETDRARSLINRIRAVVSTQDLLEASGDRTVDLRDILTEELTQSYGPARVSLAGPEVKFAPPTARAMRLVFHEMATNALKYGSLSAERGKVTVDWHIEGSGVEIVWRETGGPAVGEPASYNFGSRLITRTLKQLNAEFEPTFARSGYSYRIILSIQQ